ncbi:MAG: Ig-like domain-containing protein, partial [Fimbriimonadaceae bacterium]
GEIGINVLEGLGGLTPSVKFVRLANTNGAILSSEPIVNSFKQILKSFIRVGPNNRIVRGYSGFGALEDDQRSILQIFTGTGIPLLDQSSTVFSVEDMVVDASSQLLVAKQLDSESEFAYGREPSAATVILQAPNSFCRGVLLDSQDRVIAFGQLNGHTFVRQDQQGIDANDDTYFGLFPSTLTVPAPGVLLNDAFHNSSTLTLVTQPAHGTVALDADGGFDYTATQPLPADDSFTYKIRKGAVTSFGTVNIRAVKLDTLQFASTSVRGGSKVQATLSLTAKAPSNIVATLAENSPFFSAPAGVVFAAGVKEVGFECTSTFVSANTNVFLTATFQNVTLVRSIVIKAGSLIAVALSTTTIIGGEISGEEDLINGTAHLNSPATQVETLSVTATGVLVTPSTITLPVGAVLRKFGVTATEVGAVTNETLSISQLGGSTHTFPIKVNPKPILQFFTLSKGTVIGSADVTGNVTLTGKTSAQMSPFVLQVLETSASVTTPLTIEVTPGTDKTTFLIQTKAVTAQTGISIQVKRDFITRTQLLVLVPNPLDSVIVTPSTLPGGNSAQGEVKLNNLAPTGGYVVSMRSSSNALKVPASVKIQAGSWSGLFAITTLGVASPINVTVTATLENRVRTATVRLLP